MTSEQKQPQADETFPQFWTTNNPANVAYIERVSDTEAFCVFRDGSRAKTEDWSKFSWNTNRTLMTEQQALALLDWVELDDLAHVPRAKIDWFNEGDGWHQVLASTWKAIAEYPESMFRCLRKDLPQVETEQTAHDPIELPPASCHLLSRGASGSGCNET